MTVTPLRPRARIITAIFSAAFIIVVVLTSTSVNIAIPIWVLTLCTVWLYVRLSTPEKTTPKPRLSSYDIRDLRSELIENIADALPRAIVGLSPNADVIYANQAAFDMLSPDMIGRPIGAYLRTSAVRSHMERAFNGEIPPSLPVHVLQPTERHIDVDFSHAISIDPDDKRSAIVFAVLADRTQSKIAREQQADFLANASHELKTPIASLKGYIETLRGHAKNDPKAREKFLKIMGEQADRMERLVTDLLSLRRIESREHLAPSEIADLRKAIEAAQDSLSLLAAEKEVKLNIDLPGETTTPTFGKTDECVQLFLNLMENGIKLSPKGAALNVKLERLPNWSGQAFAHAIQDGAGFRRIVNLAPSNKPVWRVIITDEGPGFSRAHLPRIGERFYRVAGDLPAQEKGTGLGLAIVKHIVMRHRAGLYVKSLHAGEDEDSASGTSFSVVFAARTQDPNLEPEI